MTVYDAWLIEDLAARFVIALHAPNAFHAGYVLAGAKAFASEFDDSAKGHRARLLCSAIYGIRTGEPLCVECCEVHCDD